MSVTFTGLASGIDTASLVTQLVAAERAPADTLASKQSDLNTQKSIVSSLSSALAAFGTAARGLDILSEVQPRLASSSDAHVTVAASAGATATVHDVRVQQLARGQIASSKTFTSAGAGVAGAGSVTLTSGTATDQISYTATDSLADIAAKINNAKVGATASVLFDGTSYRLMVASSATGTAAATQFVETGTGLGLADPLNVKVKAKDAIATIDGVDVTRPTNVMSDAVDGLTFTLVSPHADSETSATVAVALDNNGLRDKVKALVSAYNSVNSALHVQLDYTGTQKGTNTLFGDSTLKGVQGALGTLMSSGYGGSTLGAIGIIRAKDGSLTLDETKLTSALASDSSAVANVFVTGGFATAVATMTDAYTRAGDGILASKSKGMVDRFSVLQTQIDQVNDHADQLKIRLEAQFTSLEKAMSNLKSQSAFLTSVLG